MASAAMTGESFRIGRVFSTMFQSIMDRLSTVGAFAAIASIASAVLSSITTFGAFGAGNLADPSRAASMLTSPVVIGSSLLGILVYSFVQSGSIHGFLASDREPPTIGSCASAGVRLALPMLGLNILFFLAIACGYVLFIVPGLMIATIFSVAGAARVAEPIGVFDAFGRSRALTKGMRWPIFGCLFLFGIAYLLIIFLVQGAGLVGIAAAGANPIILVISSMLVSLIMGLLMNSFLAALYRETILVKEGGDTQELAQIFA